MQNKKKLIFIGGEAAVGKSTVAKILQRKIEGSAVIDKDEFTGVLTNSLLAALGKHSGDRESETYLKEVKPLEYEQLDDMARSLIEDTSVIVTAPYFDSFANQTWINEMSMMASFNQATAHFIFITATNHRVRKSLTQRDEERDAWKIQNYLIYRTKTDLAIRKALMSNSVRQVDFKNSFSAGQVDEIFQKVS